MKRTDTKHYCALEGTDDKDVDFIFRAITSPYAVQLQLIRVDDEGFEDEIFIDIAPQNLDTVISMLKDAKERYTKIKINP